MSSQSSRPPLEWAQIKEIARALVHYYPDIERLDCTREDVRQLVVALPEFQGGAEPPSGETLDSILWQWMRLADEDAGIE